MSFNKHTFLEIFAVIIIIIIITTSFFFKFQEIKVEIRNSSREGNIADIEKALFFYKESKNSFPISKQGSCISDTQKIKNKLEKLKIIKKIPVDPIWPNTPPNSLNENNTPAQNITSGFCYWYVSENGQKYHLSYFLEGKEETSQAVKTIFRSK
jgi:type II secretory pathway pseudopilin PulG